MSHQSTFSRSFLPKLAVLGVLLVSFAAAPPAVRAQDQGPPPGGGQFQGQRPVLAISSPTDGATVSGPVTVTHTSSNPARGPRQVFLLIDQPAPQPGESITADQDHVAFPDGQTQLSVTLAPGLHTLQLATINREGKIGRRFVAEAPVSVIVH